MKTFKNNKGEEYLFVEIPLDAYDFCIFPDGTRYVVIYFLAGVQQKGKIVCEYSKNEPKIISTTKDITEEIAEKIKKYIDCSIEYKSEETGKSFYFDPKKTFRELNWNPTTTISEGIQKMLV